MKKEEKIASAIKNNIGIIKEITNTIFSERIIREQHDFKEKKEEYLKKLNKIIQKHHKICELKKEMEVNDEV